MSVPYFFNVKDGCRYVLVRNSMDVFVLSNILTGGLIKVSLDEY